jgi:hypothetical protein
MGRTLSPINIHVTTVLRGARKSCTACKMKLEKDESIFTWFEYVYGKKRTITDFCKNCFAEKVLPVCWNLQPQRARMLYLHNPYTCPDWLRLTPDRSPEMQAMLESVRQEPLDTERYEIAADWFEEHVRPDFQLAMRTGAHALHWARKTGIELHENSIMPVTREDWLYGQCASRDLPFSCFSFYPKLMVLLCCAGPPHAYGFEVISSVEDDVTGAVCVATDFLTNIIFYDGTSPRRLSPDVTVADAAFCYAVRKVPLP